MSLKNQQEYNEDRIRDRDSINQRHNDIIEDDDDELSRIREKRLQELREKSKALQHLSVTSGNYVEIQEQEFLKAVTGSPNVVVHFFKEEFQRCKIIDKHLNILAKVHANTTFLKMNAEKAQFFATKLNIRILPTLVFFSNGIAVDRIVGFEDIGGSDDFKTEDLAKRIARSGIMELKPTNLQFVTKQEKFYQSIRDE
ncbi:phosducin-like protein [Cavenderia fasciculata]|uniref:Phosducin-like protein n=1 Tax=Cavenderia fasciculata TaxID=261658 RepID=F4PXD1_CACFS|nr:phosducin-like protein [Cavenderia fasciculata]EGG19441.1 phosducin-like protein [Cavenderia fasciculata]|eukprot:XP_004357735.1 phosducin-like protein [Cavenderia fasciculata]